ncbi:unnamed protein product [Blepharisma stoltei]|uniref:Uncharacterized protein n=1 Tax=Blepharisma stoltei TaxID=1481888 RepID=A0AAU9I481_9CILI|nr:unnamed protein product [Blepharisma stoltei]
MSKFTESLFGCCSDIKVCLWGGCVPCGPYCLQGYAIKAATKGAEGCCMPCLIGSFLGCIGGAINRSRIRQLLTIEGSLLNDCCVHWFCSPCASCQEYREAEKIT